MTNYEAIDKYIKEFGSITTLEACVSLGITELPTRIGEMERDKGYKFKREKINATSRYGKPIHYFRYTMEDVV